MSSRPNRVPGTFAQPRIMYVLPAIDDDLEPDVKNALAIRNACATEGRCPACGVTPEMHPDAEYPRILHLVFAHEADCPVVANEDAT